MPNHLGNAVSPYVRSHADNPVDWYGWGEEAFSEAKRRDVPVMLSIGYATCHWCHVMARESFSDPVLAEWLNERFVAIKIDREEHPDVDASYLAAAGVFTRNLGWPLTVFVTPEGRAFFAGTYYPPVPVGEHPSFRQVLDAVLDAWVNRRAEVEANAGHIADALAAAGRRDTGTLPSDFAPIVAQLEELEDPAHGGFAGAPKFPVATVVGFLQSRGSLFARRTLTAMAASELRDSIGGGFFRYATRADWSEPHYERMLYDNALLLDAYSREGDTATSEGIARFLLEVLRRRGGGFGSAQDSESIIAGERNEGGYYRADAATRASLEPPAIDAKVLTGWNGLAIAALARAGNRLGRPEWIDAARAAADFLLAEHSDNDLLVRASIDGRRSAAVATLEDYGMFAGGLLELALATGEPSYAVEARRLVDACLPGFVAPGGLDPTLASNGMAIESDPSEGAYPSGLSSLADAARVLYALTADARYDHAAREAMESIAPLAVVQPIAFGAALRVMSALATVPTQLVVVSEGGPVKERAHAWRRDGAVVAVVTPAQAQRFADVGFELFEGRVTAPGTETAYLCSDFVCALPVTEARALGGLLDAH
jgi:uncharacterized protein